MFGVLSRPMKTAYVPARALTASRWYSDKAEDKSSETTPKSDEAKDASADQKGEEGKSLEEQIKEKDARIKALSDDILYTKAELQNLQRRSAEEKKTAGDHAITRLAKDLTNSIDVLDLAIKSVPEAFHKSKDGAADSERVLAELFDGVSLTRKSMLDMLRTHGIEAFDPVGEKFNPTMHDALYQAPVPGKEPGSVLDCSKVGYTIKGRLLRAAQVGVVQETS
ncbi:mge1-heat shock protein-chaperone [Malassezia pachydermatis]|uniref:GrpE protein homolog n=1 Tax=Malassezia pachydermatis TaxID=77020 RepID=A0A0N0RRW5_9BASI|nr:mge1-heat shock protein-chaperone [Malassezia pachydermatis]KOS12779.1 mge1-heat shock protein-chaperone [Malassezia pachydermatis]